MSNKKDDSTNRKAKRARRRSVTVTANHSNATGIERGESLLITKGTDFEDGDLVAFRVYGNIAAAYLYHCHGKRYAYYTKTSHRTNNRRMFDRRDLEVLGVVTDWTEPPSNTRTVAAENDDDLIAVHIPAGVTDTDDFECLSLSEPQGVICIYLLTADLRAGDTAIVRFEYEDGTHDTEPARFIAKTSQNVILHCFDEDEPKDFKPEHIRIEGRAIHFEKDGKIITPLYPVRPVRGTTPEDAEKLKELHTRLRRLKGDDDITDCTEIVRLEREIFNLEHPASDDDSILSADWIG